jgi:predicted dehydrogenase
MAEACAIGEAASRTGRHVQVCQQQRYGVLADRAREALAGRKVGLVHSWLYRQKPDIRGNWDRSWGGGHIVEWGIHPLDLCRYLIGEIETISACYGESLLEGQPDWNNWDSYAVSFRFSTGTVGTMATTYAAWPGISTASGLDWMAEGLLLRFRGGRLELATPERTETVEERRDLTLALNEAFIHALRTGDWSRVRIRYPDAVRTLAVVLAANEANQNGGCVNVDRMLSEKESLRWQENNANSFTSRASE